MECNEYSITQYKHVWRILVRYVEGVQGRCWWQGDQVAVVLLELSECWSEYLSPVLTRAHGRGQWGNFEMVTAQPGAVSSIYITSIRTENIITHCVHCSLELKIVKYDPRLGQLF